MSPPNAYKDTEVIPDLSGWPFLVQLIGKRAGVVNQTGIRIMEIMKKGELIYEEG